MGISINGLGSLADAGATSPAANIGTALQAQIDTSQSAEVSALFGSLGLGTHTNTFA